jgi:6-phospho-3-hexuloisomerase
VQPMGSLFEQSLLIFFDIIVMRLMEKKGLDSKTMFERHANLE